MNLIKLFLVYGLILSSMSTMAQSTPNGACIQKNQTVAPPVAQRTTTDAHGNTVDTQVWIDWKNSRSSDWQASQNWGCCEKLELNASTRICEDKSPVDSGLQSCTDHTQCPGDLGCLNWREDDMFNEARTNNETDQDNLTAQQEAWEEKRDEYDELQPVGGFCFVNMQCESYKCENLRCKENKICRLASLEDPATPQKVKCEEGLKKDSSGKCVNESPGAYYQKFLNTIQVHPIPGGEQCQYQLVPTEPGTTPADVQPTIKTAIKATRAAEWWMGTITDVDDHTKERDCVYVRDYFRDRMKPLIQERKEIIKLYNLDIQQVENHFKLIVEAKKDNMSPIQTLCGETTTQHDVAMRKASGKDFLCYMRTRNEMFKLFEEAMAEWAKKYHDIVNGYLKDTGEWDETKKHWGIGGKHWNWDNARTCRHWVNLLLGVVTPKKVKKRWFRRVKMKFDDSWMSTNFKNYIEIIGDGGHVDRLKKKKWQIDWPHPDLFIGHSFKGTIRNPYIPGSFFDNQATPKVENFIKSLRSPEIPESEFIHEPEATASYELRGCITKMNSPECKDYKLYVEEIRDMAKAQMMLYSYHTKNKYKHYYAESHNSTRRQLMNSLKTDTTNLENYYKASMDLRDKQNECIDKVLTQLDSPEFSGEGTGITEGSANYYQPTETNYLGGNNSTGNYKKPTLTKNTKSPIKFRLSAYRNSLKGTAKGSNVATSSAGGAGAMSALDSGSLAARNKEMSEQNAKVRAAGGGPKDMEKEIVNSMNKSAGVGGSVAAVGRGSSFGSLSGSDAGTGHKATLGDGEMGKGGVGNGVDPNAGAINAGVAAGAGVGFNAGVLSGIVGGSSSGAGAGAGPAGAGSGVHQDPTGMSDEEKDIMARNIDRNKSKYQPNEDDSLFQVVSKTYVRNLDKILTRKKKLDDGSASHPSTPSTP